MLLRSSLFALALQALAACGHNPAGKLAVDTPLIPYTAPDADELAGLDDEEELEGTDAAEDEGTPPAPEPATAPEVVPASAPPPAPKPTLPKK